MNIKHPKRLIFLSLLFLSVLLLQITYWLPCNQTLLSNFLLNLSASFFILAVTSVSLNSILEKIKENSWKIKQNVEFIKELELFSNKATTYLLTPLGIKIDSYINYFNENQNEEIKNALALMLIDATKEKMETLLKGLKKDNWEHLSMDLIFIRDEMKDTINIYQTIMPNKLFLELLLLRIKFKEIDSNVGLFNSLFLYSEDDWTTRITTRNFIFNQLCEDISKDLSEYFLIISKFRELVSKQKF